MSLSFRCVSWSSFSICGDANNTKEWKRKKNAQTNTPCIRFAFFSCLSIRGFSQLGRTKSQECIFFCIKQPIMKSFMLLITYRLTFLSASADSYGSVFFRLCALPLRDKEIDYLSFLTILIVVVLFRRSRSIRRSFVVSLSLARSSRYWCDSLFFSLLHTTLFYAVYSSFNLFI